MLRRIQGSMGPGGRTVVARMAFLSLTTTSSAALSSPTTAATAAGAAIATRPSGMLRAVRANAIPLSSMNDVAHCQSRRGFLDSLFGSKQARVKVDHVTFDKEMPHYRGTLFGFPADDVIFYSKVLAGAVVVLLTVYIIFKGYAFLTRFSMQTVARLGFFSGFICCMIIYTTCVQLVRRASINANAVYNQSIALVMHNEKVLTFLGAHPRTGEFKTYCASGGFKLPLLRRIRSGSYELSDLLGLKPRRLQMLFVLKNPATGHEGIVACDVRRETTGFLSSTNVYKSLSITLHDKMSEPDTIILIGKPEDVVYSSLLR